MSTIDLFRALVEEWDALEDRMEREEMNAENRIAALERRLAELEGGAPTPEPGGETKLIHADTFAQVPTDLKEGGPYLIDAPSTAFHRVQGGELRVRCHAKQPLDRNKTRRRSEFGLPDPRFPNNRIYRRDDYGKRFVYSAELLFPVQNFEDNGKIVCWQHHGGAAEPGDPPGRNPPLSLEFWGHPRRLRWVLAGFEKTEREILWELKEPDPGKWYRFQVEATWAAGAKGRLDISLGGDRIVIHTGQNGYDDTPGFTFARWGCYWPNATERPDDYTAENFREVWFRNLQIQEWA